MNEQQMREDEGAQPETLEELATYIKGLESEGGDYGKCVYAVSLAAYATFNYMAHVHGITGFQASCADMDILRRTRGMKNGFKIIDFNNLLYPQYYDNDHFPSALQLLETNKEHLSKAANELLKDQTMAHPNVINHWKSIAAMGADPS